MAILDHTHDPAARSWLAAANAPGCDFPIQNLPFAVLRKRGSGEAYRGAVAIGGKVWTARADSDAPIPAGTAATVLRIEGVKLIVTPACVTAGAKE